MQKFTVHKGLVAPMDRENVDTDAIIPKQFLKSIKRTGYGPNLFDAWRYRDHGEPGMDNAKRPLNPDFTLNQPRYEGAQILLARRNFGCGSSREHAPWALTQFGFKAVISTSFADIFKQNSLKNSLLPIVVSPEVHAELFALDPEAKVTIDLASQTLTLPNGRAVRFDVDEFSKHCLLNGVDELGYILQSEPQIAAFEAARVGSINTLG